MFLLAISVESKGKWLLMRHTQVSFLKFVIMYCVLNCETNRCIQ